MRLGDRVAPVNRSPPILSCLDSMNTGGDGRMNGHAFPNLYGEPLCGKSLGRDRKSISSAIQVAGRWRSP